LTPTEIIAAWKAGADLVKVFPCAQVGGDSYLRALKAPFPNVPLIASGGVNQQTAFNFIMAGAAALGIGGELIPRESVHLRQDDRICELARRFIIDFCINNGIIGVQEGSAYAETKGKR
jgi:2-dehydro-3-deoxyphosphogluconate aldolase/(4S)-4-hydroxy-2-oxoglutarate aldolase